MAVDEERNILNYIMQKQNIQVSFERTGCLPEMKRVVSWCTEVQRIQEHSWNVFI